MQRSTAGSEDNYPPCNVERLGEDRYQISLALGGFCARPRSPSREQNVLTVEGRKARKRSAEFLYQGISSSAVQASGSTWPTMSRSRARAFDNGLPCRSELVREFPEAMKPRRIAINGALHPTSSRSRNQGGLTAAFSRRSRTSAAVARRGGLPMSMFPENRCMDAMHLAPCCAVKIRVCEQAGPEFRPVPDTGRGRGVIEPGP